jgi:hypothetical protein
MKINRRAFLRQWAGLAGLIPFLPLLVQRVQAMSVQSPKDKTHTMRAGHCSKCSCQSYIQDPKSDNPGGDWFGAENCTCGHSYNDHS